MDYVGVLDRVLGGVRGGLSVETRRLLIMPARARARSATSTPGPDALASAAKACPATCGKRGAILRLAPRVVVILQVPEGTPMPAPYCVYAPPTIRYPRLPTTQFSLLHSPLTAYYAIHPRHSWLIFTRLLHTAHGAHALPPSSCFALTTYTAH